MGLGLGLLDLTENGSINKSEEVFVTNDAPNIKRVSFYKDVCFFFMVFFTSFLIFSKEK